MSEQSRRAALQSSNRAASGQRTSPALIPSRLLVIGFRLEQDVLAGLPLLGAVRRRYPHCRLGWLTSPEAAPLLAGHPSGVEVCTFDPNWRRLAGSYLQVAGQVRSFAPSVAIDLTGSVISSHFAKISRARRRIGHAALERTSWLARRRWTTRVTATGPSAVETRLRLLEPLGVHRPSVRFGLATEDKDQQATDRMLEAAGLDGPFALVHAGARDPRFLWRSDRLAAVIRHLGREHDVPTLLLAATAEDCDRAETIRAASRGYAHLVSRQSVARTVALVRRARFVLSADSWLLHAAAAVEVPSIGLYGPETPAMARPFGDRHLSVRGAWAESAGPQERRHRAFPARAMDALSHGAVCRACEHALFCLQPASASVVEERRRRRA